MDESRRVVVVGAGASGCMVASRLASGCPVTLVEAGPDLRGRAQPDLRDGWTLSREHSWGFVSEPQGMAEPVRVLRTKLVGGTAWVTRFAVRNHPADYELWDRLVGGGWGFDDVLRTFADVESDLDHGDDAFHGKAGPISVTRYPMVRPTEFEARVRAALSNSGLTAVPDLNAPGVAGYGRMPMNSVNGRRSLSVDLLATAPPHLEVRDNATVDDVLMDDHQVTGVRLSDGSLIAARRVVLTAGVYGSPCILMRSGIGPASLLESLGIEVRIDLPGVGENLSDHPAVSIDTGYRTEQREGPILHLLASFHSPAAADGEAPDLALWAGDPEGDPAEGWFDILLWRPAARGRVQLASADPADQPRIWLPEPTDDDVAILTHGVREALALLDMKPLRSIGATRPPDVPHDPDALRAWVRAERYSLPHSVGTCAMGRKPDQGAVVDAAGRVHGTEGLYVADSSIMPTPPTGFPHLITVMLGQRLADEMLAVG